MLINVSGGRKNDKKVVSSTPNYDPQLEFVRRLAHMFLPVSCTMHFCFCVQEI